MQIAQHLFENSSQQLEEFKGRIMEQHNDLKKELREERKRREDLADEFDAFRKG